MQVDDAAYRIHSSSQSYIIMEERQTNSVSNDDDGVSWAFCSKQELQEIGVQ